MKVSEFPGSHKTMHLHSPFQLFYARTHASLFFTRKKLKEVDYELRLQGLLKSASSNKSGSGLELHCAAMGQLEYVKFLVEDQHCNPMQRDLAGSIAIHIAAITGIKCGGVQVFHH